MGLCLVSCKNISNQIKVSFTEVAAVGSADGNGNEILGDIADYVIDKDKKLYILDRALLKIKVFTSDGKYLKTMGGGEGRGPGEFIQPTSLDIDSLGNIYVADIRGMSITKFNIDGVAEKTLRLRYWPGKVLVSGISEIYVLGFPFMHKEKLIQKYNFQNDNYEKPVLSFCERQKGKDSSAILNSGNIGDIFKKKDGNVIFALPYPYEIREFTNTGQLINTHKRDIAEFKAPSEKEKNIISTSSGLMNISLISNNLMVCEYYMTKEEAGKKFITYYFDFWDVQSKRILATYTDIELGLKEVHKITLGNDGIIYGYTSKPYPRIVKYKLNISE